MPNQIELEPHPCHVEIRLNGVTIAETTQSLLLIETYAPDIFIPVADIQTQHLTASQTKCYEKPDARFWNAQIDDSTTTNLMWTYDSTHPVYAATAGFAAFDFNQVETLIDGQLVRGHVRDPHKIIKTELLNGHLQINQGTTKIVDPKECVLLHETGLPERYYIPAKDVASDYLVESPRQSVCTYKGEAIYYHIQTKDKLLENAVWSYPEPWLDFSADISAIRGLLAFYASAFDSVLIDGKPITPDEETRRTDANMLSNPTIDRTLAEKFKN